MSVLEVARAHARERASLAERIRREFALAWAAVDPARISESWSARVATLLSLLTGAQRFAAATADQYLIDVLDEQGLDPAAEGTLNAAALAGIASDGRDLASLIAQPGIIAKVALARGDTLDRAMAAGGATAELIAHTQVADAGRIADQVALTARPDVPGYVRMLVGKSCSRCIILAGKWYRYNSGFRRHPKCDCIHIPAREDDSDDLRVRPDKTFAAMSAAEQDRVFTKSGAEAIRLGADMDQVVNARRGARGLTPAGARITAEEAWILRGGRDRGRLERVDVFGRQVFVTNEGRTVRGLAGKRLSKRGTERVGRYRSAKAVRLMPESIFELAEDREDAIRLLKYHGYIL